MDEGFFKNEDNSEGAAPCVKCIGPGAEFRELCQCVDDFSEISTEDPGLCVCVEGYIEKDGACEESKLFSHLN